MKTELNSAFVKEEINLIVEENGKAYTIEIKMSTKPTLDMVNSFKVLNQIKNVEMSNGAIICNVENLSKLSNDIYAVPIEML